MVLGLQALKGSRDLSIELDVEAQSASITAGTAAEPLQERAQQGAAPGGDPDASACGRSAPCQVTTRAGSATDQVRPPLPRQQQQQQHGWEARRPAALQPPEGSEAEAGAHEAARRLPSPSASFAISSARGLDAAEAAAQAGMFGRGSAGSSSRGSSPEGASPKGCGPQGPLSSNEVSRRLLAGAPPGLFACQTGLAALSTLEPCARASGVPWRAGRVDCELMQWSLGPCDWALDAGAGWGPGYDEEKGGGPAMKPGRALRELSPSNSQQLEAVLNSSASVDGAPGAGAKPHGCLTHCLASCLLCCGARTTSLCVLLPCL